ncbi:Serine/threonine-protein kinase [Polyrhizophydium stewartii]|uniref:Serine/threonine-protein kinase n=1 Tax=Polyrhizophydium stewartii TaxID=2732419 RepID=A0ABR4N2G4_9FUNG
MLAVDRLTEPTTSPDNWTVPYNPVKGKLHVRVVEARNLLFPSALSRPYCIIEYDQNECVTREAIAVNGCSDPDAAAAFGSLPASPLGPPNEDGAMGLYPTWRHETSFDVTHLDSDITITIWDRNGTGEEIFLGMMKIRPPMMDDKLHDNWFRLLQRQVKEKIRGDIRVQIRFEAVEGKPLSASDFELLKVIGKGSFGKVLQVRKKDTSRIYAMKVLIKKDIVERQEVQHTLSERNVLIKASHPFLVGLKHSFQTPEKLYLVLDYKNGGELFYYLQRETAFSEQRAKFYICELILALEHLHRYNIIYRDLKPENILLDCHGHIALTDFGLCKENVAYDQTTNTFCGSPEYLAPEVLLGQGYGKAVDWWSLGILFYEMTIGLPPFYSENTNVMYERILGHQLEFPQGYPPLAASFCQALIERDPKKRLGAGPEDAEEIKRHPYLADVDWKHMLKRRVRPPFKPKVESEMDTTNFDPAFTNSIPVDSVHDGGALSETLQENFKGFTFTNENQHMGNSVVSQQQQ